VRTFRSSEPSKTSVCPYPSGRSTRHKFELFKKCLQLINVFDLFLVRQIHLWKCILNQSKFVLGAPTYKSPHLLAHSRPHSRGPTVRLHSNSPLWLPPSATTTHVRASKDLHQGLLVVRPNSNSAMTSSATISTIFAAALFNQTMISGSTKY
jgi:hypothetical protein